MLCDCDGEGVCVVGENVTLLCGDGLSVCEVLAKVALVGSSTGEVNGDIGGVSIHGSGSWLVPSDEVTGWLAGLPIVFTEHVGSLEGVGGRLACRLRPIQRIGMFNAASASVICDTSEYPMGG